LLAAKAVALARIGDVKAALAFSDASIEERGDTPYIWLARADVLLARREKRADYCFEKARLLAPGNWFIHWLASRIKFYYQKFALALKSAQDALALDASRGVIWLQLAKCQQALGMIPAARISYEQVRQLLPSCREASDELLRLRDVGAFRSFWQGLFAR
jgi:tetratricopeptide (TPR) repeat protein